MSIIHGVEENFKNDIEKKLVIVDFYADWCGPCKMFSKVLEQYISEHNDIDVVKINVDECPNLSREYGVMSIPTIMIFKSGKLVATRNGFIPEYELDKWVSENR